MHTINELNDGGPTNSNNTSNSIPMGNESYLTSGGLTYAILSTISLFLMIILSIIYGRLDYNRIFVYFCISMVTLYIPHVLGAWIYGANLRQTSQAICWIQALWINASGIAAGFTLLVGIVLPALIAEKPNGILPGPYFCVLYKPEIAIAFVSIQGWNTLTSLFGIYFSIQTAIVVVKFFYIRKGVDRPKTPTTITQNTVVELTSNFHDDENENPFAFASFYVCIRLVSFGVLYCAVTILVYGRNLILSVQKAPYNFNHPFMEYIIASLGILLFVVFGTSMEAIRAY
ncbi:hypothetical protein RclHR1_02360023 [Rhizophagus clarus]|uniref:Uncharacterized protein n=1 Tax=Rhizophagus clarus TaxID=94130 RepID=A0A2Z6QY15_9GLOM|nr:hypothetical protein RclHR1_02360023 [Rhizophagus clarus]